MVQLVRKWYSSWERTLGPNFLRKNLHFLFPSFFFSTKIVFFRSTKDFSFSWNFAWHSSTQLNIFLSLTSQLTYIDTLLNFQFSRKSAALPTFFKFFSSVWNSLSSYFLVCLQNLLSQTKVESFSSSSSVNLSQKKSKKKKVSWKVCSVFVSKGYYPCSLNEAKWIIKRLKVLQVFCSFQKVPFQIPGRNHH